MRIPSIKTLETRLLISRENAKKLRLLMEENNYPRSNPHKNPALLFYNEIGGTKTSASAHGIESIGLPEGCFDNCQTPDVSIYYVNRGDTYDTTLMIVDGSYRVGDWGSIVEAYQNSHQ